MALRDREADALHFLDSGNSQQLESLVLGLGTHSVWSKQRLRAILGKPSLTSLNILRNNYDCDGLVDLFLEQSRAGTLRLRRLGAYVDVPRLLRLRDVLSGLTHLEIETAGCILDLLDWLPGLKSLQRLELLILYVGPGDEHEDGQHEDSILQDRAGRIASRFERVLESLGQLRHLMWFCGWGPRRWDKMCRGLFQCLSKRPDRSLTNLATMHIRVPSLGDDDWPSYGTKLLTHIALRCPSLESLDLAMVKAIAYSQGEQSIMQPLFPRLRQLSMPLTDEDDQILPNAVELRQFFHEHAPRLERVLSYNTDDGLGCKVLAEHDGSRMIWYRKSMPDYYHPMEDRSLRWMPQLKNPNWLRRMRFDSNGPYEESLNGELDQRADLSDEAQDECESADSRTSE